MTIIDSIKTSVLVPIHPAGTPFIAIFIILTVIIGWLWTPLYFIGFVLTIWCVYFFRNPNRITPILSGANKNNLIIAPADGIVSNINLRAGEYIKVGAPIFSLIEVSNLWIEANLKETQLTYILEGQEAEFIADSYPDVKWPSQVDTISPATGAEFALLPAQNASGNWVKVVQRLPVRFSVTQTKGMPPLRAGMTVTVSIDTRRERRIKDLWASTKSSIRELQSKYLTSEYITSITKTE